MLNNTKTQSRPKLLFLVPAISQTHKSLENSQDFFVKTKTETKTLFFVLEAPRDQDFGLEDYVTAQLSPFSALTLLVGQWQHLGWQELIRPVKSWVLARW